MYFLTNTSQSLQAATTDGIALPYTALDFTTVYVVNSQNQTVSSGPIANTGYLDNTFIDLLPTPSAEGVQYSVKSIHAVNSDSITHTITFRLVDSGNARKIFICTLEPNWSVAYYNEQGWVIYNQNGVKQ